ncbi:MAG: methyltransferase domain-containing protein [Caldilineales bacterium]|nr:methyltransferase domain-containing protein [Caldilineales bacterium]MDW8316781.1 methyltransferase domain-containing protein [Anaerolineae bacterium]
MSSREYHLRELAIAQSPDDPRHVMPTIRPWHRRILDVGGGAGQTLIASRNQIAADALQVSLDLDLEALRLGQELTSAVCFVAGSAEALPFADASFDLVISRVTLPLTYLPAAVAEIGRVTAVGGEVWLVLHSLRRTLRLLAENLRQRQLKHALYRCYVLANGALLHLTGRLLPFPSDGHYESFQTTASIRRELERAGFADLVVIQGRHFVASARKRP